jgi:hypothetical protein
MVLKEHTITSRFFAVGSQPHVPSVTGKLSRLPPPGCRAATISPATGKIAVGTRGGGKVKCANAQSRDCCHLRNLQQPAQRWQLAMAQRNNAVGCTAKKVALNSRLRLRKEANAQRGGGVLHKQGPCVRMDA